MIAAKALSTRRPPMRALQNSRIQRLGMGDVIKLTTAIANQLSTPLAAPRRSPRRSLGSATWRRRLARRPPKSCRPRSRSSTRAASSSWSRPVPRHNSGRLTPPSGPRSRKTSPADKQHSRDCNQELIRQLADPEPPASNAMVEACHQTCPSCCLESPLPPR
jgi:hypothetical protein